MSLTSRFGSTPEDDVGSRIPSSLHHSGPLEYVQLAAYNQEQVDKANRPVNGVTKDGAYPSDYKQTTTFYVNERI